MIYYKTSGTFTEGDHDYEQKLLRDGQSENLEDALIKLRYFHTLDIGSESSILFELHMNHESHAVPAAIGFMNFGDTYETYFFQSRHAVMLFLKEFSPTILAVDGKVPAED